MSGPFDWEQEDKAMQAMLDAEPTDEDLIAMDMREHEQGLERERERQADIGADYGICQSHVSMIQRRRTWTHI